MQNGSMRWAMATCFVLALSAPASAQSGPGGGAGAAGGVPGSSSDGGFQMPGLDIGGPKAVDPATAERRKEIERQYKDATRQIPVQSTVANDPWANMRGAGEVKPAAKPAARTVPNKKPAVQ
jgi:hypothetical protein